MQKCLRTRKMTQVYQVTQEQFNLIEKLKHEPFPLNEIYLAIRTGKNFDAIADNQYFEEYEEHLILRYIGGDPTIKFEVKEKQYLLSRIDSIGKFVYFKFSEVGNPIWDSNKCNAFTAPLDEISKWQTPAWKMVEVDA